MTKTTGGQACLALLASVLLLLGGCATVPKTAAPKTSLRSPAVLAEDPGIEVIKIRLTAAGRMLDFRYRVTEPERAKALLGKGTKAYVIHQPSGTTLGVPDMPLVGKLQQSTMLPEKGRVYFALFDANRLRVEAGDKVTVVFGNHRFENLTVQ